jgi:hypothetical protein
MSGFAVPAPPAPAPKERRGMAKGLAVGCGAAFLLVVAAISVVLAIAFGATAPATRAADHFLAHLRDDEYAAAYQMATPALQRQLVDAGGLKKIVDRGDAHPREWKLTTRKVESGTGECAGSVTLKNGREERIEISLEQHGETWRVSGFHFRLRRQGL